MTPNSWLSMPAQSSAVMKLGKRVGNDQERPIDPTATELGMIQSNGQAQARPRRSGSPRGWRRHSSRETPERTAPEWVPR